MYPNVIATLFTIASTWKQPRCPSTGEWIKKMWYVDIMEYYSTIKKEWNWVICSDVDEPRVYRTEWSKSEREKNILYINVYRWNLERWYRWVYFQGISGDTDIGTKSSTQWGKEKLGPLREKHGNVHSTVCKYIASGNFAVWCRELKSCALWPPRGMGWGGRWGGGLRGGTSHRYTYIPVADSCWYMEEINTLFKAIILQLKIT